MIFLKPITKEEIDGLFGFVWIPLDPGPYYIRVTKHGEIWRPDNPIIWSQIDVDKEVEQIQIV